MAYLTRDLFTNDVFLSVLVAGVVAQGAKILLLLIKDKKQFHLSDLVITGGMPSAHSALVGALSTIIFFRLSTRVS